MSHSCALHTKSTSLTMEKSVQCDDVPIVDVEMIDTEKENQEIQVNVTDDDVNDNFLMTNGHTPFPQIMQTDASMTSKQPQPLVKAISEDTSMTSKQPQPLVKAISEERYPFLQNILGKRVKDDMNMEILDFHSIKEGGANFSLNPLLPKPASLVTIIKFQGGEFVEAKSTSSYNSSMCLRDMKSAITAALDSCITQSNLELSVAPSPPRARRDMSANNTANNSPQSKNGSPKKTPPKRVSEGTVGISENITGTLDSGDSTLGAPKVTHTGLKATKPKGTTEGTKEKPKKKTPEKVKNKNVQVSKEMPQTSKTEMEAPTPKPAKPAQVRVKKPKMPDEESIKFANRQREIMKMKKELKERLKREGKEGVDPAARINAWGRTVGVTCTMCGNHVQKSYGCFRRDTAPARLVHLFTPGMNRIKICRRCLPYKKHAGKFGDFESNMATTSGLKSLGINSQGYTIPQGLSPQPISPIAIAPLLADKPVSTTTLNAIHRKVTAGQENAGLQNIAPTSHVNNGSGHVNIGSGHMNTGFVPVYTGSGNMNTALVEVDTGSGHMNTGFVRVNTGSGNVNTGRTHVSTGSVLANRESGHVIDSTAPSLPPDIDLGDSGKGSAIEYIRKLALNLKANYNEGESSMAGKLETITPEEQIIKTPIFEHLSSFTPVTPSMNLGNHVTNPPNVNPAPWKPVLNQVTPVSNQASTVTPTTDTIPSFGQGSQGSVMSTPPWTTGPIVLKSQPAAKIVLTSSNQVPRDSQTFVTTANQNELKLVPAIMVPSQNTFGGQGPVLLQIQCVKLVRENTGEKSNIQDKGAEFQGKHNETMVEQSVLGATDVQITEDNMLIKEIGGYIGPNGESTDSRQSLPEEISFAEVENAIGALQSLGGVIPVMDTSGDTHGEDMNIMDTMGHLRTEQDHTPIPEHVLQEQSQKPSEDMNVVDSSNVLKSQHPHPNTTIESQLFSSGSLGMSYSQHEPTVVICGSADVSTQNTAMYPSGYQVIDEKDDGQLGILEAPTNTFSQDCIRNIFESQISEEYLPQEVLNEKCVDVEKLNQTNKLETIKEYNDDSLLPQGGNLEEKELQDVEVPDVESGLSEDRLLEKDDAESQNNANESMNEDFTIRMKEKEDSERMEGREDDIQNERELAEEEDISHGEIEENETDSNMTSQLSEEPTENQLKETENIEEDVTDLNMTTRTVERLPEGQLIEIKSREDDETGLNVSTNPVEGKETKSKEATLPEIRSISVTLSNEDVPLDRRRSQRRTASPRKLSPSKSPVKPERKIEPRLHGTRLATRGQKGAEQQGTHKDKSGQLETQKDKTVKLGTQKDKVEQERSQKDEKEHEATQGVKRKRGRPSKVAKTGEDVGSSENVKNSKLETVIENRNSPSKRMKTRKD